MLSKSTLKLHLRCRLLVSNNASLIENSVVSPTLTLTLSVKKWELQLHV